MECRCVTGVSRSTFFVMRTRACHADKYAGRLGKTLRVGDRYKIVDSSNSSAMSEGCGNVKGLAKLVCAKVHEAIKHLVATKQLRSPI